MNLPTKYSKELIELRRAKVLELIAQGLHQSEISNRLGVSQATVCLDLQYLRCTAQEKLKTHIEERIPMQYEECNAGLKFILKRAYEIAEKSTKPQEVLAAMSLAVDIYGKLMDLSTNGSILEKTVKWLEEKKEKDKEEPERQVEHQELEQEQEEVKE